MSLEVSAGVRPVPIPTTGAVPRAVTQPGRAPLRADTIAPAAHRSVPISPPPRHLGDGTPEVLGAAAAVAGLAIGGDAALVGAVAAIRTAGSYAGRLAGGIVRCVSDPVKTGEHIAEGVVGGAAWAGAAAGVSALADAARAHVSAQHLTPH
jgi:hypothetical protein